MLDGLNYIEDSINKILQDYINTGEFNLSPKIYMDLYSTIHRLADDENDTWLGPFNCYKKTIEEYIDYALNSINNQETARLVDAFLEVSEKSKILIYIMRKIFGHLDKFYTRKDTLGSLCANGMRLFYNKLFHPFKDQLSDALIKMIDDDRDAKVVARNKIAKLLKIFEDNYIKNPEMKKDGKNIILIGESTFKFFNEFFDEKFYDKLEEYLCRKTEENIASMSTIEYVKAAFKYLDEEERRKEEYLPKFSHEKINQLNLKYFIDINASMLAKKDTGVRYMLINKHYNELKETFELLSKQPECLKAIADEMFSYINEEIDYYNKNVTKEDAFGISIENLKKEMDSLVEYAFENHFLLVETKNQAFLNLI